MKKTVLLFALVIFCSFLFGQYQWVPLQEGNTGVKFQPQLLSADHNSSVIEYSIDGFYFVSTLTQNGEEKIIEINGGSRLLDAEAPDLMKLTSSVIIPNVSNVQVNVIEYNYQEFHDVEIAPSKGNLFRNQDPDEIPFVYGEVYENDEFYPGTLAELGNPYIIRDYRGIAVHTYPFQYNPQTKVLRVYDKIVVKVEEAPGETINPLTNPKSNTTVDSEFRNIYASHFLNYSAAKNPLLEGEQGAILIISYGPYMEAMEPYVEWKNQIGHPTTIYDVATVGSTAAQIKTLVEDYYNNHDLTYLLLVGDGEHVPPFNVSTSMGAGHSDNVYGYLTGNDHYADIFVGRFSAQSIADVETQVQRTLEYEKVENQGENWWNIAMGVARNEGAGIGHHGESDCQHMDIIRDLLLTYNYVTVHQDYDHNCVGVPNTNATQISNRINNGVSLINYCNHGSVTGWSVASYGTGHVNALTNVGKLPLIWAVACVNGNFVGNTCFAETWLRATSHGEPTGALATLMSTVNQSWHPPMYAQDAFNEILIGMHQNNIKRSFGGVSMNGCFVMNDINGPSGYEMTDTWTLFGDPSVRIRTDNPLPITINHVEEVIIGTEQIIIDCDVEDAYVALTIDNQIIGGGFVSGGQAVINVENLETPWVNILVVATGYNRIPAYGNIEVIEILEEPVADFVADPTTVLEFEQVQFTCLSTDVQTWNWDFGDGNTSTQQNPVHTYLSEGQYTVSLTVYNYLGEDTEIKIDYITVLQNTNPPVAGFHAVSPPPCHSFVQFTDQSSLANAWQWDFGDGNTSNEQNPLHQYSESGTYTVTLTVSNNFGQDYHIEYDYINIDISDPPQTFGGESCGEGEVTLNASGEGILNWYDDLIGGNLINTGNSLTENFSSTTTYYVESLIIDIDTYYVGNTHSNSNGNFHTNNTFFNEFTAYTDFTLVSVEVNAGSSGNRIIELRNSFGNLLESQTVFIPAGVSRIELNFDITPGNYQLRSGTANPNLWRNNAGVNYPYAIPEIVSITGSTAGEDWYYFFYDWEIQISEECASALIPVTAVIHSLPQIDLGEDIEDCGGPVDIYAQEGFSSYIWNSEQGNHVYTVTETQQVNLEVTDENNCPATTQIFVTIHPHVEVETSATPEAAPGANNGTATATVISGTAPYYYAWSNGGTTETITGLEGGIYEVTVTDSHDCETIASVEVPTFTGGEPYVLFEADITNGCEELTVQFTDMSYNSPTGWQWDFGDGNGSTEQHPVHTYESPGNYSVSLYATNNEGSAYLEKENYIIIGTTPLINVSNNGPYCEGETLELLSEGSVGGDHFSWSGPHGFYSEDANPQIENIQIMNAGQYTLVYTESQSGCFATSVTIVEIFEKPDLNASGAGSYCEGENINLSAQGEGGDVFLWTGPQGFESNDAMTTIIAAQVENSGLYTVTYTNNSSNCYSVQELNVEVSPITVGGFVSGGTVIEPGENSGNLVLNDYTGEILKWQYSPDLQTWNDIAHDEAVYVSGPLYMTTYFRAVVKSGACTEMNSEHTTVSVNLAGNFKIDTVNVNGVYHVFYSYLSSTSTFYSPIGVTEVDVLVVGGGGGGAGSTGNTGRGGGGAGGVVFLEAFEITEPQYEIVVGEGGAGGAQSGQSGSQGENSVFHDIIAIGGGRGGNINVNGGNGGSGGGSGVNQSNFQGGTGQQPASQSGGFGSNGGGAGPWAVGSGGGGGGGAGQSGGSGTSNTGGAGGNGMFFELFEDLGGSPDGWFAGGGGASGGTTGGAGGTGGGGSGSNNNNQAANGITNTGGGGGGSQNGNGGTGGSGIVIISHLLSPQSDFVADQTEICVGATVNFSDISQNAPDSWYWTFEGGSPENSTQQNPSITYSQPGVYSVTLMASNTGGNSTEIKSSYITVYENPVVDLGEDIEQCGGTVTINAGPGFQAYTWNGQPGEQWLVVNESGNYQVVVTDQNNCQAQDEINVIIHPEFYVSVITTEETHYNTYDGTAFAEVTGGSAPFTFVWDNQQTEQSLTQLSAGTYFVTVTDANGCTATAEGIVEQGVVELPMANFSADVTEGCDILTVQFTDLSTNNPHTWLWDFGDGNTSTEQHPQHTYSGHGIFSVSLTVYNVAGSGEATVYDYIGIGETPQLSITTTSESAPGAADGTASVSVSSYYDYSVNWNIGEYTETISGLEGGFYCVTVTPNIFDCPSEDCVEVLISGLPPFANFTAQPTEGCDELTVQFNDLSTNGPQEWIWNFGDGNSSTQQNPIHTYTEPGIYSVSLEVFNSEGSEIIEFEDLIVLEETPQIFLAATQESYYGSEDGTVTVFVTSEFDYTVEWCIGETTETVENLPSGNYCVTVTNINIGCYVTECINVTPVIANPPIADFTSDVTHGCDSLTVQFLDMSSENPTQWLWNFGDGFGSALQNPVYTYSQPGVYTVTLIVTNPLGSDTMVYTDFITVGETPQISLNMIPESYPGANNGIAFVTVDAQSEYDVLWSTNQTSESIENLAAGEYCVTVTTVNNCIAIACIQVTSGAAPVPVVNFTANITNACNQATVQFTDLSTHNPTSWLWDFGDGNSSELQHPEHHYQEPGVYHVMLTAENQFGSNYLQKEQYIKIGETPEFEINVTHASGEMIPDGSASVTITAGIEPHSVLWSTNEYGLYIENLLPGPYSVLVSDAYSCMKSKVFTVEWPTGISSKNIEYSIYPNPSDSYFFIEFKNKLPEKIELVNLAGQLILIQIPESDKTKVEVAGIAEGVYFVRLYFDDKFEVEKLIINH